jgi:hypothetical protein
MALTDIMIDTGDWVGLQCELPVGVSGLLLDELTDSGNYQGSPISEIPLAFPPTLPPVPTPVDPLLLLVADGVTAELNLGAYTIPIQAVRYYQPKFNLSEMSELKVSVVPKSISDKPLTRSLNTYDCKVDIGIQQRCEITHPMLDALTNLVYEIAHRLRTVPLSTLPDARFVGLDNEPVFAPEHLDELRQFTSVLTATYRLWR